MKSLAVLILVFASSAYATLDYSFAPPENLTAQATARSIGIFWEHEREEELLFLVNVSNGLSEFTTERSIAFGGLEPNTSYTVTIVVAEDDGGPDSESASITIITRDGEVQNLRALEVTDKTISVEWDALESAFEYQLRIQREQQNLDVSMELTSDTFFLFSGLMESTYYLISVLPLFNDGEGSETTIRVRTDGPGAVVVPHIWRSLDIVLGGQAEILRPLSIPNGPYNIQVNFPCPVRTVEVWNAELNVEASNFSSGVVVCTQSQVWELEKSEIGMNFFFDDPRCNEFNGTLSADFGIELETEEEEEEEQVETPLTVLVNEWFPNSLIDVPAAGTCNVWITPPFTVPQPQMMDIENPKPPLGTFVIALNPGEDCPEGFNIQVAWGFTQKNTEDIPDVEPGTIYFIQSRDDWFSGEAGFLYGYNPFGCESRNISARLITGAPYIDDVHEAPDA